MGIEFLKAAVAPVSTDAKQTIDVDIKYVLSRDSDIGLDWFQRSDDVPGNCTNIEKPWWEPFAKVGCLIVGVIVVVLVLVGAGTVLRTVFAK